MSLTGDEEVGLQAIRNHYNKENGNSTSGISDRHKLNLASKDLAEAVYIGTLEANKVLKR